MGKFEESVELLKKDLDEAEKQWTEQKEFKSFLQRNGLTFDDLKDKFDPQEDENEWKSEYNDQDRSYKLIQHSNRMAFLKASRKEFHEEYDPKITDCDFMRLLELPYTDPRFVIEYSKIALEKP